ncbi:type II secretion system protein N [Scleromatobacter humisilvae]|uniref:Type II secretion system protein N n=1 Tax=Scleromatobacter humisilvae TaxID=2897159 RepID=A0A9X1YJB6_9BURK|nr:type II secretion system protein N [Scleromatobacter humisilvae]MCK9685447.1 type II secretion system protein N [Scleromatobacter humisilvae]
MSVIRLRPAKGSRPAFSPPPVEGQVRLLQRHRRLAIVGAAIGLVVGLVATLPASLLANAVASATNDTFLLAEAEGTIWSGSAITVLTGGVGSHDASVLPTRLEWTLRPRWNGVSLHLTQDCCLAHGMDLSLRRTLDAWRVDVIGPDERGKEIAAAAKVTPGMSGADSAALAAATPLGQWPMGWLEGRGFPWNTIHPGGVLTLSTHNLSFALKNGHWSTLGSAQVEIRQASSRLTTLDSLGTYRVLIQPDPSTQVNPGDGASRDLVWISTIDGALLIDGRGLIGATGVRIRAEAHAAAGSEAALNNLLNLIGRRNGAMSDISIG